MRALLPLGMLPLGMLPLGMLPLGLLAFAASCNCQAPSSADAGRPPVVEVGPPQAVLVGATVVLDGRGSFDPDGDPITFAWTIRSQPDGGAAALSGATTAQPSFVPSRPGPYVVQLEVRDGTRASDPGFAQVTALNRPPVAEPGENQTVWPFTVVALDGGGSRDPDGDPLSYAWVLVSEPDGGGLLDGGTPELTDALSPHPSFIPERHGAFVVRLVVDDGTDPSAPSDVVITVRKPNTPPVARASATSVAPVGTVVLDGTGSTDDDGDPLTYGWVILSRPDGGLAVVTGAESPVSTLLVTTPGDYVVGLTVHDADAGASAIVDIHLGTPCRMILELGLSDAGTGVHRSQLGAPAGTALPVLCDMETGDGGWTLLYKKSAGVVGNAWTLWASDGGVNAEDAGLLVRGRSSADYLSPLVPIGWPAFEEASVELYADGGVVKQLQFDVTGSTSLSWFAPPYHTFSTWTDLPVDGGWQTPQSTSLGYPTSGRIFSIQGSSTRTWYINATWPGCTGDVGWMMVSHATSCGWEGQSVDAPSEILYAPGTTSSNIQSTFRRAESLLVWGR